MAVRAQMEFRALTDLDFSCLCRESRFVGETELTYAQIKRIVDEMGVEYSGSSYNIFLKYVQRRYSFCLDTSPEANCSPLG